MHFLDVSSQRPALGKLLMAVLARKRFLTGVSAHMILQIAGLFKYCTAAIMLTFIDFVDPI